jgi:hypothetical protein
MKAILSLIISGALVVSGYSQTRNVLVGTNNAVVQPTNFWSADASNARTGLGLGSAATNPSSAFQPSSSVLTNLSSSNAGSLTNIPSASIVGVVGLSTNVTGIVSISNGGTGSTNSTGARTAVGLGSAATNLATAFQPSSSVLSNLASGNGVDLTNITATVVGTNISISNVINLQSSLDSKLATNGSATALTNFPASLLRTNGDASGLANFPTLNQNTTGTASNVTGVVGLSNGGTGATNASGARAALELGTAATNPSSAFQPASSALTNIAANNAVLLTNVQASNIVGTVSVSNIPTVTLTNIAGVLSVSSGGTAATNAGGARTNLGLTWSGLTNANAADFQSALFSGASINVQNQRITNLSTPTASNEAATKSYVDNLIFRVEPSIVSFSALSSGLNVFEIGTTISTVNFSWLLAPTNITLTSQTISPVVGSLNTSLRSTTLTGQSISTDTTWSLVINDGFGFNNSIVTNSSSIVFRHYFSWGRSSLTNLNNTQIQQLHTTGGNAGREFRTDRFKTFTVTANDQYVYFAYPASFGSANTIKVAGLVNSAFVVTTNTYTNLSGNISSFLVYRTLNTIIGDNITYEIQ